MLKNYLIVALRNILRHKVRNEHPGKYEYSVNPAPNPDEFFHAKIVFVKSKVRVYVNDIRVPRFVVDELTYRKGGKIGLWMDFVSDGTFANINKSYQQRINQDNVQ